MSQPVRSRARIARRRIAGRAAAVAVACAGLHLAPAPARADSPAAPVQEKDVTIKRLESGVGEITLPDKAARRLDIQTSEISVDKSGRTATPYASVIYDLDGAAWVYSVTAPLTYVRKPIQVETIKSGVVYLKSGPPAGTKVVIVGVAELYGTEVGVNGE
jgi:zona occludens toxin (predicted ATPase)